MLQHNVALAASLARAPVMDEAMAREEVGNHRIGHRVRLVRTDGSEVRGHISAIYPDSVELITKRGTAPVSVKFDTLAAVKGPGLSRGAKIGIGVGVGVLIAAGAFALVAKHEIDKPWNYNLPAGLL